MKLKDIKGLLDEKMYDPTKKIDNPDDYPKGLVKGYNQALWNMGEKEIELDEEKMREVILKGVESNPFLLVNTFINSGEIVSIAEALAKTDIIKVKEAK